MGPPEGVEASLVGTAWLWGRTGDMLILGRTSWPNEGAVETVNSSEDQVSY